MELNFLKAIPYNSKKKLDKAFELRNKCVNTVNSSCILIGDSFISRLEWRHKKLADSYFRDWLNLGIGGDKAENLLWRINNGGLPANIKKAFISIGTNNIYKSSVASIVNTIIKIGEKIQNLGSDIYICAQYPRCDKSMSTEISKLNKLLEVKCDES